MKKKYEYHGMWNTRFYRTYHGMMNRCKNNGPRSNSYKNKGIKVERNSFEDFKNDMYDSYLEHVDKYGEKNTSINRIDNDGNYCKLNCDWGTYTTQSLNTSRNLIIEKDGIKKTAKERSIELGINENTIRVRYLRGHDPLYIGKIKKKGSVIDLRKKHCDVCKNKSVRYVVFYHRIKVNGRTVDKAINTPKK